MNRVPPDGFARRICLGTAKGSAPRPRIGLKPLECAASLSDTRRAVLPNEIMARKLAVHRWAARIGSARPWEDRPGNNSGMLFQSRAVSLCEGDEYPCSRGHRKRQASHRIIHAIARVAKLADAPDLGSGPARGAGSSPVSRIQSPTIGRVSIGDAKGSGRSGSVARSILLRRLDLNCAWIVSRTSRASQGIRSGRSAGPPISSSGAS